MSATVTEPVPVPDNPREWPELSPLWASIVEPLPCRSLAYRGVFRSLERKHLVDVKVMLAWHRQQLSLPFPVMGNSKADAVLVVAAAMQAITGDEAAVGYFVRTITKKLWRRVYQYIPAAIKAMDRITAENRQRSGKGGSRGSLRIDDRHRT